MYYQPCVVVMDYQPSPLHLFSKLFWAFGSIETISTNRQKIYRCKVLYHFRFVDIVDIVEVICSCSLAVRSFILKLYGSPILNNFAVKSKKNRIDVIYCEYFIEYSAYSWMRCMYCHSLLCSLWCIPFHPWNLLCYCRGSFSIVISR